MQRKSKILRKKLMETMKKKTMLYNRKWKKIENKLNKKS